MLAGFGKWRILQGRCVELATRLSYWAVRECSCCWRSVPIDWDVVEEVRRLQPETSRMHRSTSKRDCWDHSRYLVLVHERSLVVEHQCNVGDRDSIAIQDIPLAMLSDETTLCVRKDD